MADPSELHARANDDEWIRSVVTRALMADSESDEEMSSATTASTSLPPDGTQMAPDWPSTSTLDTAAIRSRAAAAAERSRQIAEAGMPAALAERGHSVAVPPQPSASAPTAVPPQPTSLAPAVAPAPATPEPSATAAPPVEAPRTAPTAPLITNGSTGAAIPPFFAPVASPEEPLAPEARLTPEAPSDPQDAVAPRQVQTIEPARVEPGFMVPDTPTGEHPVDEVMAESAVSTDGFRSSELRTILEWLAVIGSALAVALLIKAFVLQAFWIPSESMETTVNAGDRILVNKVSYRLHEVRRGDLVVFRKIEGTVGEDDLIKRAIALPGETIEVRDDGRIWIWGPGEGPEDALLLDEPYLDPQNQLLSAPSASAPLSTDIWHEGCTNTRTPGRCTLDDSSFFMLGDNRSRSADSRFFGPVPQENVVGRAFVRIWPLGDISTL